MTSGAPWSVKGIDPKAREIAKDLARRSGLTLGEWLNQVILEDGPLPEDEPAVRYPMFGRQAPQPSQRRYETPSHPGDEIIGVTEALGRLTERIEAAEQRTTLAIGGVEQSVAGVMSRLTNAEREQTSVAARFEGVIEDIRTEQSRVSQKLHRVEEEASAPRAVEALRSLEEALGKVASHLYEGESRTRDTFSGLRQELDGVHERLDGESAQAVQAIDAAVQRLAERLEQAEARTASALVGLKSSFGELSDRLQTAESAMETRPPDSGLEQLAATLSARIEDSRAEMAEKIRQSADGRVDRMERTLQDMTGHVQAAERRSAQAVERMGHEVLRMADTLARKVKDVETRSAEAIEQVGGEVARIADVMESRLAQADSVGAQALEKLGGEIARITERLAERIGNAERRSAQAIDDVGNQVTRVSERLQDRQERVSSELADRIRQSEERTAKLLEDARERIDRGLAETQRRMAESARPAAGYADPAVAPFGHDSFAAGEAPLLDPEVAPFGVEVEPPRFEASVADDMFEAEPAHDDFLAAEEPALLEPEAFDPADLLGADDDLVAASADPEPTAIDFDDEDDDFVIDAQAADDVDADEANAGELADEPYSAESDPFQVEAFADVEASDAAEPEPEALHVEPEPVAPARPLTTRELIEQARAAARASAQPADSRQRQGLGDGGSMFTGIGFGHKKVARQRVSTLRAALIVSGGAAALSLAAAGYVLIDSKPGGALPERVAEVLGQAPQLAGKPVAGETAAPMAAVALSPQPLVSDQTSLPAAAAPAATPAAPPSTPAAGAAEIYADAVRRIESHDFSGVGQLRKAANQGYAPAEFYLAKLSETGEAGVKKDLDDARRWTERAAQAGDPKAMHNLALYYFEGTGGPKNTTTAAQWFHRAADLGLVDSQYNLGRLYEEGFGVSQNPAEAYKWYLIAAKSGDAESRMSALRLKNELSSEAQSAAERAAQGFQAADRERRRVVHPGRQYAQRRSQPGHGSARAVQAGLLPGPRRRPVLAGAQNGHRRLPTRPKPAADRGAGRHRRTEAVDNRAIGAGDLRPAGPRPPRARDRDRAPPPAGRGRTFRRTPGRAHSVPRHRPQTPAGSPVARR